MPYKNKYNAEIANQVNQLNQGHVRSENEINDNVHHNDVVSPMESTTLHNDKIEGGSGYAAATLQDLGFEPTLGATAGGKPKRVRKKKGEGVAGAGVAGAGVAGAGVAGAGVAGAGVAGAGIAGAAKKARKTRSKKGESGGALLTLQDLGSMHGQPPPSVQAKIAVQSKPEVGAGREVGGARKKRNDLVRDIMRIHKMSLPEASKHIKSHKLY